jgi:hypothetical protein
MRRLYIIDLSVLAHKANALRLDDPIGRKRGYLGSWVKSNISVISTFDWDTEALGSDQSAIVFVLDSKPYWRAGELKKVGIAYKKGRKSRTRKGLSYFKALLARELITLGIPVLGLPGQEADDMASLFCRTKPKDLAIRLVTTDNDWCGLIDPVNSIDWYCLQGYNPRYRATLAHVQESRQGKESKITDLDDFYQIKARIGDKGDNLPPGCPIWAVDLLNPLPQFDPVLSSSGEIVLGVYENFDHLVRKINLLKLSAPKAKRWLVQSNSKVWIH